MITFAALVLKETQLAAMWSSSVHCTVVLSSVSCVPLSCVDPVAVLSKGGMESFSAGEVLGSVRGELCPPKSFATVMVGIVATGCSSFTEHLGVEVSSVLVVVGLQELG